MEPVRTQASVRSSKPDWSCIATAEQTEGDPTVVTNEGTLRGLASVVASNESADPRMQGIEVSGNGSSLVDFPPERYDLTVTTLSTE